MAIDFPIRWRWSGRIAMRVVVAGGIAAAIAGGIAFAVSESLPKEYDAQTRVIVGSLTTTNTDELDAYQRLAQTYAELATSSPLLTRVIDRVGLSEDPFQLARRIDVRAFGQGILVVDATAASPSEAARIASAVADEILTLATPAGETASLAAVVQPASLPDGPSSPRVLLNTLVAAFLGLGLGLGWALLMGSRETPTSSMPETPEVVLREPRRRGKASGLAELHDVETDQLATAVYVTGSTSLEPGRRYIIKINGRKLQVLGPVDLNPGLLALDRPLAGVHATALDGRVVVTEPRSSSGVDAAFMSVAGATAEALAAAIDDGARAAARRRTGT